MLSTSLRLFAIGCLLGCSPGTGGPPPPGSDAGPARPGVDSGAPVIPPMPPPDGCATSAGADFDGDGFPNGADCNDCSAQINPGAFDAAGNGIDEDCDGADATATACDSGLPMTPGAAMDAARAIGLCRMATSELDWGVVSARFTTADGSGSVGSMSQVGIVPSFGTGNAPREGASMLLISSGVARAPGQPGYTPECDEFSRFRPSGFPPTFPQESRSCPGVRSGEVFDSVALEVTVRVPTNAQGLSFRSAFFTYEYPGYICEEFNDFFAVLRSDGSAGWENIVFDADENPVSVNNSLLRACEAGMAGSKYFDCPLGRAPLAGTGFGADARCGDGPPPGLPFPGGESFPSQEVGGGTGWLRTVAPVNGGDTITLRFAIWDSGDEVLDSSALIDDFRWELEPVMETETVPDLI